MKKLLVLAVLSAVFSASAVDQYFYWMVDSNATVYDPRTSAEAKKIADISSTGYATIKFADSGTYLNFYDSPGGTPYGSSYPIDVTKPAAPFDLADNGATFAGVFNSEMSQATKFILELYTEQGQWIGQNEFSYGQIMSYLTEGGMSTPQTSAMSFSSFQSVPEPTSGLLLLLGVAGLALRRRKMQKA